ncbi:MAG: hypothetical protein ACFE9S_15660 [Candidatus Hermodarchaeota archaeon]
MLNREPGAKASKEIRKKYKQRQKERKKKKEKKRERTKVEEQRLDDVALKVSKKWGYLKCVHAIREEKGGYEVHGWMQKNFPDYDWLIDNYVLDRACYYANIEYIAEPTNFTRNLVLDSMFRSVLILPKKDSFDHYPEFKFDRIVILSKEPLDSAVNWIDNYPWILDNYDTTVNLGPANLLNNGFAIPDLPVAIIKDAPGKNETFFEAKTSAEKLVIEQEDVIKKYIFQLRHKEKVLEEQNEELRIESDTVRKMYSDLKFKMLSRAPFSDEEEFQKFEKKYYKKPLRVPSVDIKRLVFGIILIALIVLLIIGLSFLFTPPPSPPTTIPEGAMILNSNSFIKVS